MNETKLQKCCICGRLFSGIGNNPYPVKKRGRCCDGCNSTRVIPERVRRLLVDRWKELFKDYDAVILPVGSGPAKKLEGSKDILDENTKALEEHLQIGNFGGFPSITIPDGFIDGLPVGVNITGNCYDDANILNIAYAIESTMNYKGQIAKEVK